MQLSCSFFVGHTTPALIENKMIFRRTLITIGSDDMILCRIIVEGAYLVSGLPIKIVLLEKRILTYIKSGLQVNIDKNDFIEIFATLYIVYRFTMTFHALR